MLNQKYTALNIVNMAVILPLVIALSANLYYYVNHPLLSFADQTIYIEMARQILEGKTPYIDFFDWNPPLVMYICVIPQLMSQIFNQPSILCFNVFLWMLTVYGVFLSLWLTFKYAARKDLLILVSMVYGFAIFDLVQTYNYGEREHIFVLTYFPFFVLRGLVWRGVKLPNAVAIVCGLIAGVGFAFKPQFLICAGAAEIVFAYQFSHIVRSLLRPEIYCAAGVGLLYVLALLSLPRASWDVYLNTIMPLYVVALPNFSRSFVYLIRGEPSMGLGGTLFVLSVGFAYLLNGSTPWIAPMAAFTLASFFNYFYGNQAWTVRFLPMDTGSYVLFAATVGVFLQWLWVKSKSYFLSAGLLALGLVCAAGAYSTSLIQEVVTSKEVPGYDLSQSGYRGTTPFKDLERVSDSIVRYTKPNDKIVFVGWAISPGYPAIIQTGRRPGSRYLYSVMILLYDCMKQLRTKYWLDQVDKMVQNYADDFKKNKPKMVIMEQWSGFPAVMDEMGFFEACMKGYRLLGVEYDMQIYIRSELELVRDDPEKVEALKARVLKSYQYGGKKIEEISLDTGIERSTLQSWIDVAHVVPERPKEKTASKGRRTSQVSQPKSMVVPDEFASEVNELRTELKETREELKQVRDQLKEIKKLLEERNKH